MDTNREGQKAAPGNESIATGNQPNTQAGENGGSQQNSAATDQQEGRMNNGELGAGLEKSDEEAS